MMTDAQKFHELTGGCWHRYADARNPKLWGTGICTKCESKQPNPTYAHADEILKRMKEFCGEERYSSFIQYLQNWFEIKEFISTYLNVPVRTKDEILKMVLLQKAIEFLEDK